MRQPFEQLEVVNRALSMRTPRVLGTCQRGSLPGQIQGWQAPASGFFRVGIAGSRPGAGFPALTGWLQVWGDLSKLRESLTEDLSQKSSAQTSRTTLFQFWLQCFAHPADSELQSPPRVAMSPGTCAYSLLSLWERHGRSTALNRLEDSPKMQSKLFPAISTRRNRWKS